MAPFVGGDALDECYGFRT